MRDIVQRHVRQVLSSDQVRIVRSTLGALALHGRLVVALLWKAGDENTGEGKNAVTYLPLWVWLVREFGVAGALVSYLMLLSWIVTPVLLALLYRKSLALQRYLVELSDRLAIQSRQQQVERLKRDGARKKPGRRR